MNRVQAFRSFGFFSAGLVGAVIAQTGLDLHIHLALIVPAITLATLVMPGRVQPVEHKTGTGMESTPRFSHPSSAIMILMLICLPGMLLEGANIDWSAIYMCDIFSATPFWSGFVVALGAGGQALTRFFADSFVQRWNPVLVARTLLVLPGIGILIVLLLPGQWLAYAGLAMIGAGSAALFPLAMSTTAQRIDRPATVNVAALAQISFVSFLPGPPLPGYIAEHINIRRAFGVGVPLVVPGLIFTDALAPRRTDNSVPTA